MNETRFDYKIICDNIHGPVGISKLEQEIINTRTYQRLKKIKQLGLAHLVFPGAEHTRFSHSIGVMYLMSEMVDQLRKSGCDPLEGPDSEETKQKLRLAALLHDIGHYPLSHIGEDALAWYDKEQVESSTPKIIRQKIDTGEPQSDEQTANLLRSAGPKHKNERVSHEALGKLILTNENSEIHELLKDEFDPEEIAGIFNGEDRNNPFFVQLISSSLDCDRMDYLLRDSHSVGVSYGHVDKDYIIQNMRWDKDTNQVYFEPKAINALEHFLSARFHYYNITYHKTVRSFEIMAKALFYAMLKFPRFENTGNYSIINSFHDLQTRIKSDELFLANFNDEYFWFYLDHWIPHDNFLSRLRSNLYNRIPLRLIGEQSILEDPEEDPRNNSFYKFLLEDYFAKGEFRDLLEEMGITESDLAPVQTKIEFESVVSPSPSYKIKLDFEEKLPLIKVKSIHGIQELISLKSSVIGVLNKNVFKTIRLYALVDENVHANFKSRISEYIKTHFPIT